MDVSPFGWLTWPVELLLLEGFLLFVMQSDSYEVIGSCIHQGIRGVFSPQTSPAMGWRGDPVLAQRSFASSPPSLALSPWIRRPRERDSAATSETSEPGMSGVHPGILVGIWQMSCGNYRWFLGDREMDGSDNSMIASARISIGTLQAANMLRAGSRALLQTI